MTLARNITVPDWRGFLGRQPVVLVWLSAIAVAMFFVVTALSRSYTAQSQAKASEWYSHGVEDVRAGRIGEAANDFRVALTYWRDNFEYQVSLAQSLLALDRTGEARVYLTTLWQRQPENGTVNLELARLYAKTGDFNNTLRFYHNAIYAIWDSDPEIQRRATRIELAEFLLNRKSQAQAESELIALSGNLPADPALHARVGDLLMRVPDYKRALEQYESSLRLAPHSAPVLAAAGHSAFDLGRYALASHYLQLALALDPGDATSTGLLTTTKMIQDMDPNTVLPSKRASVVLKDFGDAGSRLNACIVQVGPGNSSNTELHDLNSQWAALKPHLTARTLRNDPDLADSAVDLVFSIETKTNNVCGQPSGPDLALLLIAEEHGGD